MASTASKVFKALRSVFGKRPPADIHKAEVVEAPKAEATIVVQESIKEAVEQQPPPPKVEMPNIQVIKSIEAAPPTATSSSATKPQQGGGEINQPSVLTAVKAHVPMIKFKKGSLIPKPAPHMTETTFTPASVGAAAASDKQNWNAEQVISLDWWQTPQQFKRRNVDDLEIDLINSGGADKLFQ